MQPAVCFLGGGLVVLIGAGGLQAAAAAVFPEAGEGVGFAEVIGRQLQQRLGAFVQSFSVPFIRRLICLMVDSMWLLVMGNPSLRYWAYFGSSV